MEHVVFHSGPDGAPAFRRFSALDEAVRFVEHLRNVEGVEDASVHMLTPVPLAFRAYYKVEVPTVDAPVVPEQAMAVEAPAAEPVPVAAEPAEEMPLEAMLAEALPADVMPADAMPAEPVADVPVPEPAASANGKRSLGFFAH